MDTNFTWGIAIALESVIIYRGLRAALVKRYPFFYAYIGCVLLADLLRIGCLKLAPEFYASFYWYTRLATNVASYGIVFEIFRQALRYNPGMARVAQKLLAVVFVLALSYAASDLFHSGLSSFPRVIADAGRYLLYIEGAVLLAMLWLFGRYRISFGRNLLGLTAGYSLLVGLDVLNFGFLTLRGHEASVGLRKLLPITYIVTLVIWCASLWSPEPDLPRCPESVIDQDYGLLAAKTGATFSHLSARVGRAFRQ